MIRVTVGWGPLSPGVTMLIALLLLACSSPVPSCPTDVTTPTDTTTATDSATTPTDSATPCTPVAWYEDCDQDGQGDRKSTRLNSSHMSESRMPCSA